MKYIVNLHRIKLDHLSFFMHKSNGSHLELWFPSWWQLTYTGTVCLAASGEMLSLHCM